MNDKIESGSDLHDLNPIGTYIPQIKKETTENEHRVFMLTVYKDWIPCSERLPDNGVAVLVYTGENNFKVWLAEYSKYMEVWTLAGNYVPIKKNAVSHWMPLPNPPTEQEV